jgi:hypothetical protein
VSAVADLLAAELIAAGKAAAPRRAHAAADASPHGRSASAKAQAPTVPSVGCQFAESA